MKDDIVIPSTNKGFLSTHIWAAVWLAALWIFKSWCEGYATSIEEYVFPWPICGIYGSYAIMLIILLYNIYTAIYNAREISILRHGEDGFLEKAICYTYGVPFSKRSAEMMFNKVIRIVVVQGSIDRLLDTGRLNLEFITFTSADSKEFYWTIPAIKNPYGRKKEIEESLLLQHEGLLIKK